MYRDGLGVPQDYIQAHLWFNLAAARFPAAEKEKREAATEHRDTVGAKMTPEQVAEAQKLRSKAVKTRIDRRLVGVAVGDFPLIRP